MKHKFTPILILPFLLLSITACKHKTSVELTSEFKKYFDDYKVKGSFILYDQQKDAYFIFNQEGTKQLFTPASTFKICNSLIGLETGIIKDEHFVLKWDSIVRPNPAWNMDQDMKTAFANSTVWYYQELARRVGATNMKYWLNMAQYGNADTTGGIDQFWLTGSLRITPMQQIDFLKRLHEKQLPFSERSVNIVKNIMLIKDSTGNELHGKTGWGSQDGNEIGWFVGYVETKDDVYYFSNCTQAAGDSLKTLEQSVNFDKARTQIVYNILRSKQIIK